MTQSTGCRAGRAARWSLVSIAALVAALIAPRGAEAFGRLLAIDPQRPDTVYVGTHRGVFKSTDAGATWTARNAGMPEQPALSIMALAMDPKTPTTLYVGTTQHGVFKSVDGGMRWTSSSSGLTSRGSPGLLPAVTALAIDPRDPATVYAGAGMGMSGTPSQVEAHGRVFKSTDGGATWRLSSAGVADMHIMALVVDPHAPGTVLATTSKGTLFRSTDGAATWHPSGAGVADERIGPVVPDPRQPGTLYAGTTRGVYKSVDGGATWRPINAGIADVAVMFLAVHGGPPTTMYAGAIRPPSPSGQPRPDEACPSYGLFRSADGGATWQRVGALDFATAALTLAPRSAATLYAVASDGVSTGVAQSVDGGAKWLRKDAGLGDAGRGPWTDCGGASRTNRPVPSSARRTSTR